MPHETETRTQAPLNQGLRGLCGAVKWRNREMEPIKDISPLEKCIEEMNTGYTPPRAKIYLIPGQEPRLGIKNGNLAAFSRFYEALSKIGWGGWVCGFNQETDETIFQVFKYGA